VKLKPPASSEEGMEGSRPRSGSQARVRTVRIAVTPEGFWCCPSPAALHKSLKNPHHHHAGGGGNKQAPQQLKTPSAPPSKVPSVQTAPSVTDEPPAPADEPRRQDQPAAEAPAPAGGQQEPQHKICVGFGRPETSDLTVMLYGKEGIAVRMGMHRDVLCQSSAFFAARLAGGHGPPAPCVEIHDCDDAKIYVETVETVSCITARLFVGIGREEMLPSKNTRLSLLQVWLQPLINDYSWLQ